MIATPQKDRDLLPITMIPTGNPNAYSQKDVSSWRTPNTSWGNPSGLSYLPSHLPNGYSQILKGIRSLSGQYQPGIGNGKALWDYSCLDCLELTQAIKASKSLLYIEDESEDEGPKPPDLATWENGSKFLWRLAEKLRDTFGQKIEIPFISPTPFGGISFYWNKEKYRLLITIRPNGEPVTYYGDNTRWESKIKGSTATDEVDMKLVAWLSLVYE